uniref:Uncharacterized protein n=1 Tax=Escherichia coli TaxID=562 RepID=A0A7L7TNR5_ECOLX|nr:hypothetical protein p10068_00219 [Escherichia coli]
MHLPAAWVAALPGIVDILLLSTLLYPVQWISTTPGSVRPKITMQPLLFSLTLNICKRKLTAVCSHQTRIGNLDAHLI